MRKHVVAIGSMLGAVTAAVAIGGVQAAPPDAGGAVVFAENCAACHQAHGEGVAGAFPKLVGNAFVRGPAPQVAYLLTHGRGGMPSFANDLSDAKIAAVLTYVRSSWGNKAPPIAPSVVAASRRGAVKEERSVMPYH